MTRNEQRTRERKSAKAYLLQAAIALCPKDVTTPEAIQIWMQTNAVAIATKASDLQWEMWNKLQKPAVMQSVRQIISARVWGEVNKREINRKVNVEIVKALEC